MFDNLKIINILYVDLLQLEEHLSYLPTPPLGEDMTQGQFFKRS